jgi:DEAD/DEAH box helicase domain-containing protein
MDEIRNIVVFDLETQRTADEVGGWHNIRHMGLAVAVTYHPVESLYRDYTEREVEHLVTALCEADVVVGYNLFRFDYEVLRAYTDAPLSRLPTVDMLKDLHQTLGWRPKLDDVASATLGERKSANGLQAVRWFRANQLDKVIAYCRRDVEVTWKVYDFGRRHGYVQYHDRRWRARKVPVRWSD